MHFNSHEKSSIATVQ